jgi:glycosyltransferase involved in cell wall biosynthesis
MKILYFSNGYTPHDHRFLSAIIEGGHEALFLRLNERALFDARPIPEGVRAVSGSVHTVIEREHPDLVHAGPLHTCAYLAAKTGFRPLVAMSWGSDILLTARRNWLARRRVRFALQHVDAVIGDCDAVRQAIRGYGVADKRIVTFPWGIDLDKFSPRASDGGLRAKLGWQDKLILLHLRSWEPLYDPLTVAQAFVVAAQQNANLRLLMPGAGSLAPKIRRIFERAGLLDRIHLPGTVAYDELSAYYRSADLYVSASLSDGSSVSLMEALACGLPALVSDIPSNREWVQAAHGRLFPLKDETALSAVMLAAAANMDRAKMASASRKFAELRADWARNKQQLFAAYDLALEGTH